MVIRAIFALEESNPCKDFSRLPFVDALVPGMKPLIACCSLKVHLKKHSRIEVHRIQKGVGKERATEISGSAQNLQHQIPFLDI